MSENLVLKGTVFCVASGKLFSLLVKSFFGFVAMHTMAMDYASQSLYLVLIISLPPILIASVIGIVLSLIQAVTQLQEQTLTFGVKLIAVFLSILGLGGWMCAEIMRFAGEIFSRFYLL